MTDTELQLQALKTRLDNLEKSSNIPRDVETAFRERLGLTSNSTATQIIFGGTVVADGSGAAVVTDARVKTTSAIVVSANAKGGSIEGYCNVNGTLNIDSSGSSNYFGCTYSYIVATTV